MILLLIAANSMSLGASSFDRVLDFPSVDLFNEVARARTSDRFRDLEARLEQLRRETNVGRSDQMELRHVYSRLFELSQLPDRILKSIALTADKRNRLLDSNSSEASTERNDRAGVLLELILAFKDRPTFATGWKIEGNRFSYGDTGRFGHGYAPMDAWKYYEREGAVRRHFSHFDKDGIYIRSNAKP